MLNPCISLALAKENCIQDSIVVFLLIHSFDSLKDSVLHGMQISGRKRAVKYTLKK